MQSLRMLGPEEIAASVAERARELRLAQNLSQAGLAAMSGVSEGSLKRFERTGQASFELVLRVALALDATAELETWFSPPPVRSIDEALTRAKPRQRGRRR